MGSPWPGAFATPDLSIPLSIRNATPKALIIDLQIDTYSAIKTGKKCLTKHMEFILRGRHHKNYSFVHKSILVLFFPYIHANREKVAMQIIFNKEKWQHKINFDKEKRWMQEKTIRLPLVRFA
jgi:hypothetical protein